MHSIKISSQKIKFGDKEVDKKEFYSSKEAIFLNSDKLKKRKRSIDLLEIIDYDSENDSDSDSIGYVEIKSKEEILKSYNMLIIIKMYQKHHDHL